MEYFDVVDEKDRPVGKLVTKAAAHKDGTWHRLVAVYVFDRDGKLLIQDHKLSGMLDHSVGGHVAAGEDYGAAAVREAQEELGLINEKLDEVFVGLYSNELFDADIQETVQMHHFGIYECRVSDSWQFVPNDEVEKLIPMELADVVKMMNKTPGKFTPGIVNTMAKYLEVKQSPYKFDLAKARKNWGKTR